MLIKSCLMFNNTMKNLKDSFLLICLLGLTSVCLSMTTVYAQGTMKFNTEKHNFGELAEGVMVSYEFEFVNTGNKPVKISKVTASCGCTTPYWSKEPILPGKKGKIKATYNTTGRPGNFNKSITVNSNATNKLVVLFISGKVNRKKKTYKDIHNGSAKAEPKMFMRNNIKHFGMTENRLTLRQAFEIRNTGNAPLVINKMVSECKCTVANLKQKIVPPGGRVMLELMFTPTKAEPIQESFYVYTNDAKKPRTIITLSADVYENFSRTLFRRGDTTLLLER